MKKPSKFAVEKPAKNNDKTSGAKKTSELAVLTLEDLNLVAGGCTFGNKTDCGT